jgi:hypothetical protein
MMMPFFGFHCRYALLALSPRCQTAIEIFHFAIFATDASFIFMPLAVDASLIAIFHARAAHAVAAICHAAAMLPPLLMPLFSPFRHYFRALILMASATLR